MAGYATRIIYVLFPVGAFCLPINIVWIAKVLYPQIMETRARLGIKMKRFMWRGVFGAAT
jgi:hypothetical protein